MNIDPHSGVPMERSAYEALISTPQPYSYIWRDGMLYAMPGGSTVHSELADRLGELLRAGFGGWRSPCRALRDKYVEIPRHASLLPDLVVTCADSDFERDKAKGTDSSTIQHPRLIAEVLSPESTAIYDETEKRELYQRCLDLEVYLLLEPEIPKVKAYCRANGWQQEIYTDEQHIPLAGFSTHISLPDLYTDILAHLAEVRQRRQQGRQL